MLPARTLRDVSRKGMDDWDGQGQFSWLFSSFVCSMVNLMEGLMLFMSRWKLWSSDSDPSQTMKMSSRNRL